MITLHDAIRHSKAGRLMLAASLLAGCARVAPPVSPQASAVPAVQEAPKVWTLCPINGHKPDVWSAGGNWKHADGNPLADHGGTWTLAVQDGKNPSPTAPYAPMTAGTYVGYTLIWQGGPSAQDPAQQYRDTTLTARPTDGSPQAGPASALLFRIPDSGLYTCEVAGQATVQNPSAGHAQLTFCALSADRTSARPIASLSLNAKTAGAFGGYPDAFEVKESISLQKGEEFAVRLQAVNPGPATAGTVAATFSRFRITRVPPLDGRGVAMMTRHARVPTNAVVVDVDRALTVNGYSQIERQIFGLTAYHMMDVSHGAQYLADGGIESVGMPVNFGWVLPAGVKTMDATAIDAWFADPKGAADLFFHYAGSDRYVYGKILPPVRASGVEPWLYLQGNVPGHATSNGTPTDDALWGKLAAEYVTLCKRADPKLTYVHIWNEPNVYWFKDSKAGKEYASLFKEAAGAIKKACPDMKVGGPVLCWPPTAPENQKGQAPWYTWDQYSRPLMDAAAGELDFFDWHAYGQPAAVVEGELHIVTGYAQTRHGKWLRNAITETSFDLKKTEWADRTQHFRRRVLPMMRQAFMLLRNPDKIFCQQVHDIHAYVNDSGMYRFMGDTAMAVTPMQEFYVACKPLRGTRLVTVSPDTDVAVEAAANGSRVTVALANFGALEKSVPLALRGLARERLRATEGQVLDVVSLRPVLALATNGVVALPPESLTVLTFDVDVAPGFRGTRERNEFFAKEIMARLEDGKSFKVSFPLAGGTQNQATAAALRLGLKGAGATGRWQVKIAGETVDIDKPGAFVEVPLRGVPQGYPVEAELIPTGEGESEQPTFLSFASVVLDVETPH